MSFHEIPEIPKTNSFPGNIIIARHHSNIARTKEKKKRKEKEAEILFFLSFFASLSTANLKCEQPHPHTSKTAAGQPHPLLFLGSYPFSCSPCDANLIHEAANDMAFASNSFSVFANDIPASEVDVSEVDWRNKFFRPFQRCSPVFQNVSWSSHRSR